MLVIVIGILSILIILLVLYIIFFQLQLHNINNQLIKRLTENTRQPVRLELMNHELNSLAVNINRCLNAEENLHLNSIKEEKNFKEMIANISHDLRTPLTAIKGYQQLMAKEPLTHDQQEKLQIAQKHADELGNLIEHFFEYSYLLNAEPELHPISINLTNVVTECLADEVSLFEEHGLAVHIEESPQVFVYADKEMIVRIIQNLIRNCVTHSVGDVTVKISASKTAVVSFKNPLENSAAIDVDRLFDRFYTGDPSRHKTTGLGLSIVKLLAQRMGGSTGARLQDNVIEIWIELPLCT